MFLVRPEEEPGLFVGRLTSRPLLLLLFLYMHDSTPNWKPENVEYEIEASDIMCNVS